MTITAFLADLLEREAAVSRRVLERVPEGKTDWKPHDKSMPTTAGSSRSTCASTARRCLRSIASRSGIRGTPRAGNARTSTRPASCSCSPTPSTPLGGKVRDTVMYSILASEWPDVRRHLELRRQRHAAPPKAE